MKTASVPISKADLLNIIQQANDGILVAVGQGKHVFANHRAAEILGYSVDELLQTHFQDLVYPDEKQKMISRYAHRMAGLPIPKTYETIVIGKGGRLVNVELTATKITWGKEPADMVIFRDITERKQTEQALQKERDFTAAILNTVGAAVVVLDTEGRIVRFNRASEQVSGYRFEEINGQYVWDFLPLLADKVLTKSNFYQFQADGRLQSFEVSLSTKDGRTKLMSWVATVMPGAQGQVEYIIGTGSDITERRELELLRIKDNVIASSINAIAIADLNGRLFYVNRACLDLWGYSDEAEVIGFPMIEFFLDRVIAQTMLDVLTSKGSWIGELTAIRKDGGLLYLLCEASLVKDGDGKPSSLTATFVDLTGKKWAEERFHSLFASSKDGIAFTNMDGQIQEINPALLAALGYTLDEARKLTYLQITPARWHAMEADIIETQILKRGYSNEYEKEYIRKDGTVFPIRIHTWLLRDDAGIPVGMWAIVRDLSEEKRSEKALQESELRYQNLVSLSPEPIVVYSQEKFVYVNPAAAQLLGAKTPEELLGRPVLDFIHPASVEMAKKRIWLTAIALQPAPLEEMQLLRLDGEVVFVELASIPTSYHGLAATQVIFRDITEQKRSQQALNQYAQELERSNSELEQFAYVVSHDLQEPLRMISSYLHLLAEDYQGRLDEDADEYIDYAVEGSHRLQQLIEDLLAYSRVASGERLLQPVDCEVVLQDALGNLLLAIEENKAMITHDPLPTVMADRRQIMQLFQNLVGNAIKFRSPEPPEVHISARREISESNNRRSNWLFSVSDNGIGVAPQYFERIFAVFQRLHNRSEYPGTGIGLAICKKIVERHGGRIWVESEVGHGTIFYFSLPAN